MTFWSSIWDFFRGIFSGIWSMIHKDSREDEEDEEEKIGKKIVKASKEEERDEQVENKIIKQIVKELKRIRKELSKEKSPIEIRIGQKVVTIEQAINVLIYHIEKLKGTSESATEEERDLGPIEKSWMVVRQILANKELHKDVEKVTSLFEKLNITLEKERKTSWQKVQAVKKLWEEMQKSEGETKKQ